MPSVVQAQTTYTLTQIGTNDGNSSTTVTGIDDKGDLALTVETLTGTVSAYLWRLGTQTNIGGLTPSPQFVGSGGLNDLVQMVGTTICPTSGTFCGFVWRRGQMTALPSPAGSSAAFGNQINLLGQAVGLVYDANDNGHAVLWSHGEPTLLPGIEGGNFSQAVGINILGEIVGLSEDATNVPNTVLWRRGVLTVLIKDSIPSAINDEGQIVGRDSNGSPFLWQNGTTTQLPPVPGGSSAGTAWALNDLEQIVGTMGNLAVLWQNGTAIDLTSRIATTDPLRPYVHLESGTLVNNLGRIVALGTDSRNPALLQYYLLTPVN
jgi:uncharacterized membrane protein